MVSTTIQNVHAYIVIIWRISLVFLDKQPMKSDIPTYILIYAEFKFDVSVDAVHLFLFFSKFNQN